MFIVVYRPAKSSTGDDETPTGLNPGEETPHVLSPPCPEDAEDQATHFAEVLPKHVSSSSIILTLPG